MTPALWAKVKQAFEEISDSGPEHRFRVLQALDPETRRYVERMLHSYDASRGSSESNPLVELDLLAAIAPDEHTFREGERLLDRFEIVRFLGSGGMGEVYLARDGWLNEVAIKTLRIELTGFPATIQRFRQEVERGRRVTHPNVCRIYDLFETRTDDRLESEDAGTPRIPFFTMEFLSGQTLSSAVTARDGFPAAEALSIARQLCQGLQAAHDAGIVHGDFKSGNVILVTGTTAIQQAKITDFGLARLALLPDGPVLSGSGPIAGTRPYLAPELLAGSPPSVASDIFALGVVLFHLRTGQYPLAEASQAVDADSRRLPPPHKSLLTLEDPWAKAISACLAFSPLARPESAAQVEQLLIGQSPSVNRRLLLGGFAATAALAGTAEWGRRYLTRPPALPQGKIRTLVEDFETVGAPPAVGRAVRNLVKLSLEPSSRLQVLRPAELATAAKDLGIAEQPFSGRGSRTIARRLGARLLIGGSVRAEGARYRVRCSGLDPASDKLLLPTQETLASFGSLPSAAATVAGGLRKQLGDDALLALVGGAPLDQVDTDRPDALETFSLGLSYFHRGEFREALEYFRDAARIDPGFAAAHVFEAMTHLAGFRRPDLALPPVLEAFAQRDKLPPRQRRHVQYLYLFLLGDYEQSTEELRTLLQLAPDEPTFHRVYASHCALMSKPDLGLEAARKAALAEPSSALNQNAFISVLAETGQMAAAEKTLEEAFRRLPAAPPLLFCKAYLRLLNLQVDDALAILHDLARQSSPATLSRYQIVKALLLGGRLREARQELLRQLPVKAFTGDVITESVYRYWNGQISALLGDSDTARHEAALLAALHPIPSNLDAFRFAAELASQAGDLPLLRAVSSTIRQAQIAHPSTRSQGFLHFSLALSAAAAADPITAESEFNQAYGFWPDLPTTWAFGEFLFQQKRIDQALGFFQKAAAAKAMGIRYDSVTLWVRSLARLAACLESLGRFQEAAPFALEFRKLWGDPAQYHWAG